LQHEGGGQRVVRVCAGDEVVVTPADAVRLLARAGEAPLPPYIDVDPARGRARDRAAGAERRAALAQRYQTVYADEPGSAAAPTAGLHFTPELIAALAERGVGWATVELVVGLDTFRPVVGELDDHVMHTEHYRVPAETRRRCREAERVVAVGTTTVRALESAARGEPAGRTSLFLRRGARFEAVDALITNFHLPRSTLLVMIDAFVGDRWRDLYALAQREGYRFLSFGDAMFLERRSL
ncbi:MAG TPA: S-adenosylmethionine:tRNA ribosyltransferase-isomerase, partial [Acidimicrobiaceae bacterium]|nr:S-adenosylmethionine:tRNA ribosyltransferase-isomerase [Acidimicrobiaceae bacterium]